MTIFLFNYIPLSVSIYSFLKTYLWLFKKYSNSSSIIYEWFYSCNSYIYWLNRSRTSSLSSTFVITKLRQPSFSMKSGFKKRLIFYNYFKRWPVPSSSSGISWQTCAFLSLEIVFMKTLSFKNCHFGRSSPNPMIYSKCTWKIYNRALFWSLNGWKIGVESGRAEILTNLGIQIDILRSQDIDLQLVFYMQ